MRRKMAIWRRKRNQLLKIGIYEEAMPSLQWHEMPAYGGSISIGAESYRWRNRRRSWRKKRIENENERNGS